MFTLTINTDNAAFVDNADELADILRDMAHRLDHEFISLPDTGRLRDSNGNTVGTWSWL
jgi:hypothetical protein